MLARGLSLFQESFWPPRGAAGKYRRSPNLGGSLMTREWFVGSPRDPPVTNLFPGSCSPVTRLSGRDLPPNLHCNLSYVHACIGRFAIGRGGRHRPMPVVSHDIQDVMCRPSWNIVPGCVIGNSSQMASNARAEVVHASRLPLSQYGTSTRRRVTAAIFSITTHYKSIRVMSRLMPQ